MSEIGWHSGVRIVEIPLTDLVYPTDCCIACHSPRVKVIRTRYPSVNFLEPVRGAPYPTYAAEWAVEHDCICQDCGAHWGNTSFTEENCPAEHLPYGIYTRERIDREFD